MLKRYGMYPDPELKKSVAASGLNSTWEAWEAVDMASLAALASSLWGGDGGLKGDY